MNIFDKVLLDAQILRRERQAARRAEMAQYHVPLPTFTPQMDRKPPLEVRERIQKRIKELLSD
jgi:hypothetical protein